MLVDVKYQAGTQKAPQQTKITQPAFTDTDHVHFPDGLLSTIPAYSELTNLYGSVVMTGAVRACHAIRFTGTYAGTTVLYGANNRLYARKNNTLYNITPLKTSAAATLGTDPIFALYDSGSLQSVDTTSGSNLVVVGNAFPGYIYAGDTVVLSGFSGLSVGGLAATTFNGTFTVLAVDDGDQTMTIRVSSAATSTASRSYSGITEAFKKMGVLYTGHGIAVGDRFKISGCSGAVDGVPAAEINKEHETNVVYDANRIAFRVSTTPTGDTGGGGAAVQIFKQIDAGNLDQSMVTGYGAGLYGKGIYGQGGAAVAAQSFPRIWSFANFGNEVVMCPGDYSTGDGQKIYIWDGNTDIAPTVLTNAPTDCNWVLVVNNSVVALCGSTVKISEIGDGTVWSGITYYAKTLERVWKLVSGFSFTEKDAVLYTPNEAILLRYVGGGDLWDVSDLFTDDGILSPYSAIVLNGVMNWVGARGAYSYDGSPVKKEVNTQNEAWIIDNTNIGKSWKSFCAVDVQNGEWWHLFPTGTSSEPSDYAIHNPSGHVTLGKINRTAAQRPGFVDSQYHMVNASSANSAGTAYRHFLSGNSTFDWYATTSLSYAGSGENRVMVDRFMPDSNQSGDITVNVVTREYPQGSETMTSGYTISADTKYQAVKAAGRLIGLKFSGSNAATLGAWKLNITTLGKRG